MRSGSTRPAFASMVLAAARRSTSQDRDHLDPVAGRPTPPSRRPSLPDRFPDSRGKRAGAPVKLEVQQTRKYSGEGADLRCV